MERIPYNELKQRFEELKQDFSNVNPNPTLSRLVNAYIVAERERKDFQEIIRGKESPDYPLMVTLEGTKRYISQYGILDELIQKVDAYISDKPSLSRAFNEEYHNFSEKESTQITAKPMSQDEFLKMISELKEEPKPR